MFKELFKEVEKKLPPLPGVEKADAPSQNSIHLVISAHGADLEEITDPVVLHQIDVKRVRMMYAVSNNVLGQGQLVTMIRYFLKEYQSKPPVPSIEIVNTFRSVCKYVHEKRYGERLERYSAWQDTHLHKYNKVEADKRRAAAATQSELQSYCSVGTVVVNRLYTFKNNVYEGEVEGALPIDPHSRYAGEISPIRVRINGEFLPPDQLVNLLTDFDTIHGKYVLESLGKSIQAKINANYLELTSLLI